MDTDSSVLMLVLAFVFIFMNAFFVLSEFSIVKVRKSRLEELIKDKIPNAKLAFKISNSLDTYLSATQLGITISSLALGWIGEPAVSRLIELPLRSIGIGGGAAAHTIAFVISFTLVTLFHVVLGELVPKSIAIAKTEKIVLFISRPLHIFWIMFFPIIKAFDFIAAVSLKIIGVKPAKESELALSDEEIKIIASESLKGGVLDSLETEIIKNAVDFSDTVAKEIMTPRRDLICLNKQKSYDENYATVLQSKFTRFPYIDGSKDNVLGLIHIRDIIQQKGDKSFDKIVRKLIIVPENSPISKILPMMNKQRIFAALVIDEYGGTAGFLTMEDIIEELVGDIFDEHDAIMSQEVTLLQNGSYRVMCNANAAKIFDYFGIDQEPEANTINGWVVLQLDKLPEKGDVFEAQYGNKHMKVKVTKATARKAIEINLKIAEVEEREEE